MTTTGEATLTLYGAAWCPHCKRVKRFLAAHRVHYDFVDIDGNPAAIERLKELQDGGQIIPTVVYADGTYEVNPGDEALARRIGLTIEADRTAYDLVIVGGGPAGLAAAIYAAREGIDAIVVDASALGGQAGISDRIDNYPGFPDGISGADLAERFVAQARRYGVELLSAVSVTAVEPDGDDLVTSLSSGQKLSSHAVIVATGSTYRLLGVPGEDDLIGAGVHFCATCDGPFYKGSDEVVVIGGGNSALEEGLHLSEFAKRVRILARDDLTRLALFSRNGSGRIRNSRSTPGWTSSSSRENGAGSPPWSPGIATPARHTGSRPPPPSSSSGFTPTTPSSVTPSSGTPAGSW